jgi:uncharacterized ferritin-like protein (DUF455 family)
MTISEEERAELAKKIGGAENYNNGVLREAIPLARENIELRKALVSSIMSAEFAGIDAFSRKVVEWQDWNVPESLILAMARQTWDEVRHAQLSKGVLESYGGVVGEYPDTLAGGGGGAGRGQGDEAMRDPLISLSMTNVSLEGGALVLFRGTSELGAKVGDKLMEHCYDYNWADEVTHCAIGDYFVKELCRDNPDEEKRALVAHARHEYMRFSLTGEQTEELKEFFAEEIERGTQALAGSGGGARREYS